MEAEEHWDAIRAEPEIKAIRSAWKKLGKLVESLKGKHPGVHVFFEPESGLYLLDSEIAEKLNNEIRSRSLLRPGDVEDGGAKIADLGRSFHGLGAGAW